jgi:Tfp pilus assembly protein PilF
MNDSLEQAEMGWQVDALHTAEKAMGFNPLSVDGMFVLAGVQQRLGRVAEARATLVRATEMQPQNYLVWERLASYERDKWGEPGPASEHYARAVSLNPHDKQLRMRAGLPEETPD